LLISTLRIPPAVFIASYTIRCATNDSSCRLSTKISLFTEKPLSTVALENGILTLIVLRLAIDPPPLWERKDGYMGFVEVVQ